MREQLEAAFSDLGLELEAEGRSYLYSGRGRFAPLLQAVVTPDEDGTGAMIMVVLETKVRPELRAAVLEYLNRVHGQSLWNVRFHLDENDQVIAIGKMQLWGRPFNPVQFGDIFFSLLVTADRLYPGLLEMNQQDRTAAEAFEKFCEQRVVRSNSSDEIHSEGPAI